MLVGGIDWATNASRLVLWLTGGPLHWGNGGSIVLQLEGGARVRSAAAIVKTISLSRSENTRDILQLHTERKLIGWDEWDRKTVVASDEVRESGLTRGGSHDLGRAGHIGHEVWLLGVCVVGRHLACREILLRDCIGVSALRSESVLWQISSRC